VAETGRPLKPGEYRWAPQVAPEGPVTIIISLGAQQAYAYRNGVLIGVTTVSSGKPGHATPTGVFTILQKHLDHKSNLYSDAPMPFMQRLTWDGIAMHAGNLPGYPASHGCVRLPIAFAKLLFGVTKLGLTVVITNDAAAPEVALAPKVLEPPRGKEPATTPAFRWRPQASPKGPVSIVVSGRDRRMVVLRNGIEIGSSAITIDGPVTATQAFTLRAIDATGVHWLRLPLPGSALPESAAPGSAPAIANDMSTGERGRGHMPEAFRTAVTSILQPGATLLVTRDSLATGGTGKALTVIVAEGR